jgi:hypothetical protein
MHNYYLELRPISHTINTMITTTISTPTHTPALKISPIAWQDENERMTKDKSESDNTFFIIIFFKGCSVL